MRICFATASLAPLIGPADANKLLAAELIRQGHGCSLLSIHDVFLSEPREETVRVGEISIPSLRLPAALPWPERVERARAFVGRQSPDWFSLRFINYSFNPKGLVHGLAGPLAKIAEGARLHFFTDELWLVGSGLSLKNRIVGWLQRQLILRLIRATRPGLVHVNNLEYRRLLAAAGVRSRFLPLFGNIPIHPEVDAEALCGELQRRGVRVTPENRSRFWFFVIFGVLHPVWPPEPLLTHILRASREQNRTPVLLGCGRIGSGRELWERMSRDYEGRVACVHLGEQPESSISQLLQWADFGVATTNYPFVAKSGTVCAMIDHGMPVIVNRIDPDFKSPTDIEDLGDMMHLMTDELPVLLPRFSHRPPAPRLPRSAQRLVHDLAASSIGVPLP